MIFERPFGKTADGAAVRSYTLKNENGMSAEILTYGGAVRSLCIPVGGQLRDVVLGFDSVADYEKQNKYIGAAIGRVANRIGGASFELGGKIYRLPANDGTSCLHGSAGFHSRVWEAEAQDDSLVLKFFSPDGEEGFPGNLSVELKYSLTQENVFEYTFSAVSDADTPVILTNHSYFNLEGHASGDVCGHFLCIPAEKITENDTHSVPTGRFLDVEDTPFDFREGRYIGDYIDNEHPQTIIGSGYDHNFVLGNSVTENLHAAALLEAGGLRMVCLTNQPGVQLYTGNYLDGDKGKGGAVYGRRCALCLETQNFPDAVHHDNFPDSILRKGERYLQITQFQFSEIQPKT